MTVEKLGEREALAEMLTKRSLEKRLDDLEARADRLPGLRRRALPGKEEWSQYFYPHQLPSAGPELEAARKGDFEGLIAFISSRATAPAGWPLRRAFLEVLEAIRAEDRGDYLTKVATLRDELRELLVKRYSKWRFLLGTREFFLPPVLEARLEIDPLQHCLERLGRLSAWEVCCWAGHALRLASDDLRLWEEWNLDGERERWRRFLLENPENLRQTCPKMDGPTQFAKMRAEHELPESELALLGENAADGHAGENLSQEAAQETWGRRSASCAHASDEIASAT